MCFTFSTVSCTALAHLLPGARFSSLVNLTSASRYLAPNPAPNPHPIPNPIPHPPPAPIPPMPIGAPPNPHPTPKPQPTPNPFARVPTAIQARGRASACLPSPSSTHSKPSSRRRHAPMPTPRPAKGSKPMARSALHVVMDGNGIQRTYRPLFPGSKPGSKPLRIEGIERDATLGVDPLGPTVHTVH